MVQAKSTFNVNQFELRGFTDPYLTPDQSTAVAETEQRVNSQLDFLAQMLGWNGPNYWDQLVSTPDQKRQLMSGSFGVYNSYVVPEIFEIRNWNNTIVIDSLKAPLDEKGLLSGKVVLDEVSYPILSASGEGEKTVISIGELDQEFFSKIESNVPLKLDLPSARPAPFYRPTVGVAGDYSFRCAGDGSTLNLFPTYDSLGKFPFRNPVLFAGSVYYFDKPIYLSTNETTLDPDILPEYDPEKELWYFQIPDNKSAFSSITATLVLANSGATQSANAKRSILIVDWEDPSDWNSLSVLNGFTGTWGNKGGALPFHHAFDAL